MGKNVTEYSEQYFTLHPDNNGLLSVANYFNEFPEAGTTLESIVGDMLRLAIDEVIDMPRTGRFSVDELEKTEKTYIGTKVEIVFRDLFKLEKGIKLDLLVNGQEVDVKNTIGPNWTIPCEAVDQICILLKTNDLRSLFGFGLIICRERVLNKGRNRDQKRTLSKQGREEILWLVENGALPKNVFLHMDSELRSSILSASSGAKRLANLFRSFQGEVIGRRLVECVARQKDYMKRVRGNGGARDILEPEGLLVLWGGSKEDKKTLSALKYSNISSEHFVCVKKQR